MPERGARRHWPGARDRLAASPRAARNGSLPAPRPGTGRGAAGLTPGEPRERAPSPAPRAAAPARATPSTLASPDEGRAPAPPVRSRRREGRGERTAEAAVLPGRRGGGARPRARVGPTLRVREGREGAATSAGPRPARRPSPADREDDPADAPVRRHARGRRPVRLGAPRARAGPSFRPVPAARPSGGSGRGRTPAGRARTPAPRRSAGTDRVRPPGSGARPPDRDRGGGGERSAPEARGPRVHVPCCEGRKGAESAPDTDRTPLRERPGAVLHEGETAPF